MSSQGMTTRFRYTREHSAELTGSWFLPAALLTHSLVTRPGTWRAWALDTGHLFHSINWELSSSSRFGEVQPLPGVSGQQIDTRDTVELFWGAVGLFSQVYTVGTAPHRPGWWALRDPGWLQPCLSDVPVPEQHQRVLTNPTESQLTCSLLFFYFSSCSLPSPSCISVSKGIPQLAHGQPAWVQRHSSAALVQADTDCKNPMESARVQHTN